MTATTLHRGERGWFFASARTAQAVELALAEYQRYLVWVARHPVFQ